MKLSERVLPFLKSTPLFYQTLPFYGKNLKPPFFEKIYESLGQIANVEDNLVLDLFLKTTSPLQRLIVRLMPKSLSDFQHQRSGGLRFE